MRLIDAEDLIKRINGTGYHEQIKSNFLFIANMLPTIDAVEVVRCKDCKHCEQYAVPTGEDYMTGLWCEVNQKDTTAQDYCSCRERREE